MAEIDITQPLDTAKEYKEPIVERLGRLAALSPADYESVRKDEAKTLGWRVTTLDREVTAARPNNEEADDLGLFEPDSWPEEVDGDDLLNQIVGALRRHVVIPRHAAEATALWIVHCHTFQSWQHSPRLNVTAPEKGCGKSTLLDVLAHLAPRSIKTENLSTAVMFRVMDGYHPTLLIDEADSFLRDNEELRGALNAGHAKNARHFRCDGDDNKIRGFKTFGPVAIAGIGNLTGTLAERSIRIVLQRRKPEEHIQNFRDDRAEHLHELASQAVRWVNDHEQELRNSEPVMPDGIFNRQADNWRPLLSIANAAGGDWPAIARDAARAMSDAGQQDTESIRSMLLADIKALFEQRGETRLSSATICEALAGMEERPWPEFSRGKPITVRKIAKLLSPFGISPSTIRLDGGATPKGYKLESFKNAFERYLPPIPSATTPQVAGAVARSENLSATLKSFVADGNSSKPAVTVTCGGVADKDPPGADNTLIQGEGDAEERAAIQQFDSVPSDDSKLLEIPPFLDRRQNSVR